MYSYSTVVVDVDDYMNHYSINDIQEMINDLNKINIMVILLENQDLCNSSAFTSKLSYQKSGQIKTISTDKFYYETICRILNHEKISNLIVVSNRKIVLNAADRAMCLTLSDSTIIRSEGDMSFGGLKCLSQIVSKVNSLYKEIAQDIIQSKAPSKTLIVGINGVDTSGKTVFTNELTAYLTKQGYPVTKVHLDDFHNPSKIRSAGTCPVTSYLENAFNTDLLVDEILRPIKINNHLNVSLDLLDLESDTHTNHKDYTCNDESIVLLEGVLLFRPAINKWLDFRIYLDITFEDVIRRAVSRDKHLFGNRVLDKYKEKYIPVQKKYINTHNPIGQADILINNSNYNKPQIEKKPILKAFDLKTCKNTIKLEALHQNHLETMNAIPLSDRDKDMIGQITSLMISDYEESIAFAVVDSKSMPVGVVELFNVSWRNRRGELSILIMPHVRNMGYGRSAILAILEYGFAP